MEKFKGLFVPKQLRRLYGKPTNPLHQDCENSVCTTMNYDGFDGCTQCIFHDGYEEQSKQYLQTKLRKQKLNRVLNGEVR